MLNIENLIGNTPLIELKGFNKIHGTKVFAKLEFFNLGKSIKDRTALGLIKKAIKKGLINENTTIVESTSGNLGFSLSILSKIYKFNFICIVDPKCPKKNLDFYRAYGCKIIMVDEKDNTGGYQKNRIATAKKIEATMDNCLNLDQYNNYDAQEIHYEMTGPEIYKQMNGKIGAIISSVSTGSHLSGISKYLKEQNQKIKTIAVEPLGSVIFGGEFKPYRQNGSGLSFFPKNYNKKYIDYEIKISDTDAFNTVREVINSDGLLIGGSSGAALYAVKKLSLKDNTVVIIADSGEKYLDTLSDFKKNKEKNI